MQDFCKKAAAKYKIKRGIYLLELQYKTANDERSLANGTGIYSVCVVQL